MVGKGQKQHKWYCVALLLIFTRNWSFWKGLVPLCLRAILPYSVKSCRCCKREITVIIWKLFVFYLQMVFSDSMLNIVHQHWGGHTFSMCLGVKTKIDMGLQSIFWCINKNIHLRRSWCSGQRQSCSHGLLFCSRRFPEKQVLRNCCFYLFLNLCVHEEDS